MQVFVPYSDFRKSLYMLDRRRLQKQAIETSQLIDIILRLPTKSGKERKGWSNHPALTMWNKNPGSLFEYFLINIQLLKEKNIKTEYCENKQKIYESFCLDDNKPIWWGNELIHSSHRSRLLQKGWEEKFKGQKNADNTIQWYSDFNWAEMNDPDFFNREYQWAVNITEESYDLEMKVTAEALKKKKALIEQYGINPFSSFYKREL